MIKKSLTVLLSFTALHPRLAETRPDGYDYTRTVDADYTERCSDSFRNKNLWTIADCGATNMKFKI